MTYVLLVLFVAEHAWVLWYLRKFLRLQHSKFMVFNMLSHDKLKLSFLALERNLLDKFTQSEAKPTSAFHRLG